MAHDVFISYSSDDKVVADAACATLEARGVRCWIAPRDILPGKEWGASLIDAIQDSRAMILIFSAKANGSPQIRREVNHAVEKGLLIVPFRIEDVTPSETMEYYLDVTHWLDALTPPLENHLNELADKVSILLNQPTNGAHGTASRVTHAPGRELSSAGSYGLAEGRPSFWRTRNLLLLGALATAVLGILLWLAFSPAKRVTSQVWTSKELKFRGVLKGVTDKGSIALPILMVLQRNRDGSLTGSYRYLMVNVSGEPIRLEGRMKNQQEFMLNAVNTNEFFDGRFISSNEIRGTWRRGEQSLEFTLSEEP